MMTVAAGLRVSEVAGLTLGDILDSKGSVRSEVFLAAHRVKHQHARTISSTAAYRQSWQTTLPHAPTKTQRCHYSHHTGGHAITSHPTRWHNTFIGCIAMRVLVMPAAKTFLTSLASQGVSVFVLAALAGHKSIATTQRYVTVNDDVKRRAVELV